MRDSFRFLHVSTDEVYGSLRPEESAVSRKRRAYAPNSPYSASKAAADHLVRAYHHTYGLPTLTTNCSNNYGPFQFPEKLIPLVILNAMTWKANSGVRRRRRMFATGCTSPIIAMRYKQCCSEETSVQPTTLAVGMSERIWKSFVPFVSLLDELRPNDPVVPHANLITFVKDRPGHDRRYAMDARKD